MIRICIAVLCSAALCHAAFTSKTLTVQEMLYPGDVTGHTDTIPSGGIARANENFCTGVPFADSDALTGTSTLGLTGATAGQFRILGSWPDGNVQWLEACGVVSSVSAGSTATVTVTSSGSGNFGSPSTMTSVSGGTVTVNTTGGTCGSGSAICFTLKGTAGTPGGFDGIDTMTIGGTSLVNTGTSSGFVVMGPANPATDCATATPCTTTFSSKNDTASVCSVEKDGPVQAVVKCTWNYTDGSGNVYMNGTARFYFANGSGKVRVQSIIQNAQYGTSNTFATAFKALQASEFRLGSAMSGTLNWNIGNHTGTPTTGTMGGTDNVFLYQGQSTVMQDGGGWSSCGSPCVGLTQDVGYVIRKNGGSNLGPSGSAALGTVPVGYAELDNGTIGIQTGGFLLGANGPKSLEFQSGGSGTDAVRVGLYSAQNTYPVYISWPQHHTEEFYLNFFASVPSNIPNEYLKQQHMLVGRASYASGSTMNVSQYNNAGVFLYHIEAPDEEDAYYTSVVSSASPAITATSGCANSAYSAYDGSGCIRDVGLTHFSQFPLYFYPLQYNADLGGGRDQLEWRYSWLTNWINRGMTGRLMQVKAFEMMAGDTEFPRADFSGGWRGQSTSVLDDEGKPTATSSDPAVGTCNTDSTGTAVTLVTGAYFGPWWPSNGNNRLTVNGTQYSAPISSVNSPTSLTTSVSVGANLTGVSCQYTESMGNTILRYWPDWEHRHWWGIEDYYFVSGDQTIYDDIHNTTTAGIFDDYNLNLYTAQGGGANGANNGTGTTNNGASTLTLSSGTVSPGVVGDPIAITISGATTVCTMSVITGTPNVVTLTNCSPSTPATASGVFWTIQGGTYNTRSTAVAITNASRYSRWLSAVGDSTDSTTALQQAKNIYAMQVAATLCVSGYPSGCTVNNELTGGPYHTQGVSRTRGLHYDNDESNDPICGAGQDLRIEANFQMSILNQALIELAYVAGSSWSGSQQALDLGYGISQWVRSEGSYYASSSARWQTGVTSATRSGSSTVTVTTNAPVPEEWTQIGGTANIISCSISAYNQSNVAVTATGASTFTYSASGSGTDSATGCAIQVGSVSFIGNGMRYYVFTDIAQEACDTTYYPVRGNATVWFPFFAAHQYDGQVSDWDPLQTQTLQANISGNPVGVGLIGYGIDVGAYQLQALIDQIDRPGNSTLQTITISSFTDNGAGSYTIGWTTPANATTLRAKWGTLAVVDWLGFDPVTNAFSNSVCAYAALGVTCSGNPTTSQPWFASTEVSGMPSPVAGVQTVTVSTGTTGLTSANFMVKGMEQNPAVYTSSAGGGISSTGGGIN